MQEAFHVYCTTILDQALQMQVMCRHTYNVLTSGFTETQLQKNAL